MKHHSNKVYVGVDVSKQHLDVGIHGHNAVQRFDNNRCGHSKLVDWLRGHALALLVCEATGGYHNAMVKQLQQAGMPVSVVNPRQARDFAKATGKLAKTDRIDARMLAHFAASVRPAVSARVEPAVEALRALHTRRRQLVEMRSAERNRLYMAPKQIASLIRTHLRSLERQIQQLEQRICAHLASEPALQRKAQRLRQEPGVAFVTSGCLLAELPELGTLGRKPIAALAGLAPLNRDSGQRQGKRHLWGGRASVRHALYMATVSAVRCHPHIRPFYQRLRDAGKPAKVALTACARKLLLLLNAILRDLPASTLQTR